MKKEKTLKFNFTEEMKRELQKSYHEALEKPEFQVLVKELHLPADLLMKYTSNLEEASVEYNHCQHCKGLMHCKNKMTGYAYLPRVDQGQISFCYQACKYKQKRDRETSYLKNMYLLHVPEDLKNASLKNIYMDDERRFEAIKYVTNFVKTYHKDPHQKGLYLHGSFGSGKTYLISAAFHELAKKGVKSAIVFWPEMLNELKESFNNGTFNEKIETLKKTPLLLIDDIGAESTTAWSRDEIFCPIVQYRMQEHLPTFFTSNLTKKELEQHFSISKDGVEHVKAGRVIERINQLTTDITLMSKNLRH